MKFTIEQLTLTTHTAEEVVTFSDYSYFYGKMGAGKSTIARLIDFCLGGKIEMTPALQHEMVSAQISVTANKVNFSAKRNAYSDQIEVIWTEAGDTYRAILNAKARKVDAVPGKPIENFSDFFFYAAGLTPPKVRRSKIQEETPLIPLSHRDLLWYCYLDQDSIDSSFFHLDPESEFARRNKSKDVIRFVLGYHQEQVAELEALLEEYRMKRMKSEGALFAIERAVDESGMDTPDAANNRKVELANELVVIRKQIDDARAGISIGKPTAIHELRKASMALDGDLVYLNRSRIELGEKIDSLRKHRNELLSMRAKISRAISARDILSGMAFKVCPCCGLSLPQREGVDSCAVCGQNASDKHTADISNDVIDADVESRVEEIERILDEYNRSIRRIEKDIAVKSTKKSQIDDEYSRASQYYDSQILSETLTLEKKYSSTAQELIDVQKLSSFMAMIQKLKDDVARFAGKEAEVRASLKTAREKAEKDATNLALLRELFLDCLVRAKVPGFSMSDHVVINPSNFLPEITSNDVGETAISSFSNLGSGGKKTMFKCCYAIAMHRLSQRTGAILPSILIIDSPMKNISERTNISEFEQFHAMLYELSQTELRDVQFIMIDKEYLAPPDKYLRRSYSRMMTPNDDQYPPLIKAYRGK